MEWIGIVLGVLGILTGLLGGVIAWHARTRANQALEDVEAALEIARSANRTAHAAQHELRSAHLVAPEAEMPTIQPNGADWLALVVRLHNVGLATAEDVELALLGRDGEPRGHASMPTLDRGGSWSAVPVVTPSKARERPHLEGDEKGEDVLVAETLSMRVRWRDGNGPQEITRQVRLGGPTSVGHRSAELFDGPVMDDVLTAEHISVESRSRPDWRAYLATQREESEEPDAANGHLLLTPDSLAAMAEEAETSSTP